MKIYLVGGAVRDEILNLAVSEKDYVVVGSTETEMLDKKFIKVGKDFPVFLHPETKEEYALARTEVKTAEGYYGFKCHFDKSVTLEEDLKRRDITINAIAKDDANNIYDPYDGAKDLKNKVLRHISDAFAEDPLRVLRVARFKAKLHHLGFTIAPKTMQLMQDIVVHGEIKTITKERVWLEMHKALAEKSPSQFFLVLRECGALQQIFPELDRLWGVPQTPKHHPEIDTGVHTMMVLEQAALLSDDPKVRFASLCHDLGKGTTPKDILPRHVGHDARGVNLIKKWCDANRVPKSYRDLAAQVSKYHIMAHSILDNTKGSPKIALNILNGLSAYKFPNNLEDFLTCCFADLKGRKGFEGLSNHKQGDFLRKAFEVSSKISADSLPKNHNFKGKQIGDEINRLKIQEIAKIVSD